MKKLIKIKESVIENNITDMSGAFINQDYSFSIYSDIFDIRQQRQLKLKSITYENNSI